MLREVKQAPTNLVASLSKLTFKHNLTHFVTLIKDTVSSISIARKNEIMAKTNQMGILSVFIRYLVIKILYTIKMPFLTTSTYSA